MNAWKDEDSGPISRQETGRIWYDFSCPSTIFHSYSFEVLNGRYRAEDLSTQNDAIDNDHPMKHLSSVTCEEFAWSRNDRRK